MSAPLPPPRPRQHSIRREEPTDSVPPDSGNIARLLANEAAERHHRDKQWSELLGRIANGVDALVAFQRLPPMRPEATSQNDVMIEALRITAEATGRHNTTTSSTPPFLRDWRGPIRLTRKAVIAILLGACTFLGGIGGGYVIRDCGVHAQK